MPVAPHDASRARPGLHGLDRTVTPRMDTDVFSAIIEERPQAEKFTSVLLGIDTARFPVGS